ncbi:GNAT family N-acetyltransferase [Vibrio salinus]|uniref:GNAT family N-acetyltransferase n=1 Tax=Vibrio salinus TaxID=2899784 RepID=UPI001E3E797C|nr:N-acetyltransferase [Vibrio salinus]MCE0493316.1 N-acetyltransferase [Vibrio salinus]
MLIRTEAPADILLIDSLLKEHANDDRLAGDIMTMRENASLTLSLVVCSDEGKVIGHVAFRPVICDGVESTWQIMTPITVSSEHIGETDIKISLIQEAMNTLGELGYPACFGSEGDEKYQEFGFSPYGNELWGYEYYLGEIESKPDWFGWVVNGMIEHK